MKKVLCPNCGENVIGKGRIGGTVNGTPTLICTCGTRVNRKGEAVEGEPFLDPSKFFQLGAVNVAVFEGSQLEQAQKKLRDSCAGGEIQEPEGPLHLTRDEFAIKMRKESDGESLLALLESGEWRVCERMGLCEGYRQDGTAYIDVPGWNNLVAHLRIVDSV